MYHILYIHTHDSGRILSPYGYKVPTPEMERKQQFSGMLTVRHLPVHPAVQHC